MFLDKNIIKLTTSVNQIMQNKTPIEKQEIQEDIKYIQKLHKDIQHWQERLRIRAKEKNKIMFDKISKILDMIGREYHQQINQFNKIYNN